MSSNEEYKQVISQIENIEIKIPGDLDETIENKIAILRNTKYKVTTTIRRIAAVFIVCFLGLLTLITVSEDFAAVASTLPGLDVITEWIHQDKGIRNAHDKGYPNIDELVYEKDGYQLILSNIMIDEERISFNAIMYGEGFENQPELIEAKVNDDGEPMDSEYTYYDYRFSLPDVQVGISYGYMEHNDYGKTSNVDIHFAKAHEEKYIRQLLENNEDIRLKCSVSKGAESTWETITEFEEIIIPISPETILLSKEYSVDEKVVFNEGIVEFNKLIISPTRMRVITNAIPSDGIHAIDMNDYYIMDDKGNKYVGEGLVKSGGGKGYVSYEFVPSIYFEEDIKKICFHYKDYSHSYLEKYMLSLDDEFPKVIDYHGYKITFTEMKYKNNNLSIKVEYDETDEFTLQSLMISDDVFSGTKSWSDYNEPDQPDNRVKLDVCFENVERLDTYEIRLEYPEIIRKQEGVLEFNLTE